MYVRMHVGLLFGHFQDMRVVYSWQDRPESWSSIGMRLVVGVTPSPKSRPQSLPMVAMCLQSGLRLTASISSVRFLKLG